MTWQARAAITSNIDDVAGDDAGAANGGDLMTFSIVAFDRETGQVGLAVHSRAFAVGRIVHHVAPGVGAVASQALVLPAHGTRTLQGMREGRTPQEALRASLAMDQAADVRQVIAVDVHGRTAAHTGARCIASASHHEGDGLAVAGNILADDHVIPAMAAAARGDHPSLARRLLAALEAGQAAGGDLRGRQSAAMLVADRKDTGDPLVDLLVDVRVDDHADPIPELARLLGLAEAYNDLELADQALAAGDVARAADGYMGALPRLDDDPEFHVWAAVSLASGGFHDQARILMSRLHRHVDHARWEELAGRIARAGMVDPDEAATWF